MNELAELRLLQRNESIYALVKSMKLEKISAYTFRTSARINLQCARAIWKEIVRAALEGGTPRRITAFCDSSVVVGAVGKGRFGSYRLNGILRSMLGHFIWGALGLLGYGFLLALTLATTPPGSDLFRLGPWSPRPSDISFQKMPICFSSFRDGNCLPGHVCLPPPLETEGLGCFRLLILSSIIRTIFWTTVVFRECESLLILGV